MLAPWISGKNICVTGGTGFLGQHLLPMLLENGANVTCLARAAKKANKLPQGVKFVQGDCTTGAGLEEALAGCHILIHMAATLFGNSWNDYLAANAASCAHIAKATKKFDSKIEKTVLVSSLAAAGSCATPPGISENDTPMPVSAYGWSKLLAEQLMAAHFGEKLVILRPPIIYGSGDMGLLPLFRSVKRGFAPSPGAFRLFPVSTIHADDAARAIILATQEKASGIYHLNDGMPRDMDSFCNAMALAIGKNGVHVVHIPLWLMACTAAVNSTGAIALCRLAGILGQKAIAPPRWNLDKYRESCQSGWLADAGRIRSHLGFEPEVSLEAGMAEAVAGYRAEGLL